MQKKNTNRLAREKSPYLLGHAHNPVDWFPWGEEAFEKARVENKPIFLSVGYSTCHWCHVMEKESFENPEIAKVLNDHFIAIKVDREERPDVDYIYMAAVQAMSGQGGWPMSVFLTPQLKPFYGGTYFPPEDRWGRPGFVTVLEAIWDKWQNEKEKLVQTGEAVAGAIQIRPQGSSGGDDLSDDRVLKKGFEQFLSQFDPEYGGFGPAPKFPRSHTLSFLLRWWKRGRDAKALEMVEKTLQEMAHGGIYDHLGGGFHRYSVDPIWRIPHFEKMLYDQALLSKTYLEAYQVTKKEEYAQIAREIFEYVLRDLASSEGGFYSAEDADSAVDAHDPDEKSEGAFYLWTFKEVVDALGLEKAKIFSAYFSVSPDGNAPSDPQGEFIGKNVLFISKGMDEVSQDLKIPPSEFRAIIDKGKKILFEWRSKRLRPHLDDKILTDWNGLMISSLAFGARVLKCDRYLAAARKAADFLISKMKRSDGRFLHRFREGEAWIPGFLDDYVFLAYGLLDLYQATFEIAYLEEALFLAHEMIRLFWDEEGGGFFFAGRDAEGLIAQTKEIYDGAIPSGNAVAALVLSRLSRLTMDLEIQKRVKSLFDAFSESFVSFPSGYPQMLTALDFNLGSGMEIVIAGDLKDEESSEMADEIYSHFLPSAVIAFYPSDQDQSARALKSIPYLKGKEILEGRATAYICQNYACQFPMTDLNELRKRLHEGE